MAGPLLHGSEEMLGLFTRDMRSPTHQEEYDGGSTTQDPSEHPPALADVIDTARRRNADGDVSDHLALKTRPIRNCLEAGQSLCLCFPTQIAHGIVERSQILLTPRASPLVNPNWYARKPPQVAAQV